LASHIPQNSNWHYDGYRYRKVETTCVGDSCPGSGQKGQHSNYTTVAVAATDSATIAGSVASTTAGGGGPRSAGEYYA